MQPLDDVTALAQRAQPRLRIGGQNPDGGARRFRQTVPRERPHAPDPLSRNGSRPASRSDLKLITPSAVPASRASVRSSVVQRSAVVSASRLWRVELRTRAKFAHDKVAGAGAQAHSDITATDDEVGTIIGTAPHEDVNVRMLCIRVVDRHQSSRVPGSREAWSISSRLKLRRLASSPAIRRDNEPKMMAVTLATRDEGATVRIIRLGVE